LGRQLLAEHNALTTKGQGQISGGIEKTLEKLGQANSRGEKGPSFNKRRERKKEYNLAEAR